MSQQSIALLLVESQSLLRSTVASVARDLELARVDEVSSIDAAETRLARKRYDALLLSIEELVPTLHLLRRVRDGDFHGSADLAVVAMSHACDAELAEQLKLFEVRRLLLKPFKVKLLLQSIEALVGELRATQAA